MDMRAGVAGCCLVHLLEMRWGELRRRWGRYAEGVGEEGKSGKGEDRVREMYGLLGGIEQYKSLQLEESERGEAGKDMLLCLVLHRHDALLGELLRQEGGGVHRNTEWVGTVCRE
eukprot:115992-Chlamydomonas_euryale.AAC.1